MSISLVLQHKGSSNFFNMVAENFQKCNLFCLGGKINACLPEACGKESDF